MMVKLSDGCHVAADQITEVRVNSYGTNIIVWTKDGIGHCHMPPDVRDVHAELDRLIAEINSATRQAS
jgi:Fic family protein